jgi:hypothetical protein
MSTATEQEAYSRLLRVLRVLGECCHLPLQEALWPSVKQLKELDSAVGGLAMIKGRKPITSLTPYWKAYERVNKWRPEIKLIPRVKDLLERADQLLKEAGESELVRLRRRASEGVPKAQQLTKYLEAIQEDARAAGKITWEDYESLLGGSKPFRLPYGDSAPRGVRCYVRALQLIVDDLRYRPLRDGSLPLLAWINGISSPHAEMLKHDFRAQYYADYIARHLSEATKARQREQWRKRQRKRRRQKSLAGLRAMGISEAECERILAENA